jgi:hypothetical protein
MKSKTVAGTPADPTLDFVSLELVDGTKFKLIYDFDALARAEEITGISLLFGVNWGAISAPQLRGILFASVLKAHPETKLEDLTKHINLRNHARLTIAIKDAWINSIPDAEPDADPPQPKA